jgi:hypothetical protein
MFAKENKRWTKRKENAAPVSEIPNKLRMSHKQKSDGLPFSQLDVKIRYYFSKWINHKNYKVFWRHHVINLVRNKLNFTQVLHASLQTNLHQYIQRIACIQF